MISQKILSFFFFFFFSLKSEFSHSYFNHATENQMKMSFFSLKSEFSHSYFNYGTIFFFTLKSVFSYIDFNYVLVIICVKRLRLLPGVTTLFRDFYRRPILGASYHFLWRGIFHCWSEKTQGNILKAFI